MVKRSESLAPKIYGNKQVGAAIRRLRKTQKLTLEAVAHELGTDTGNLSRLERGEQGYTDAKLRKIADILGVKVAEFFVDEPAPPAYLPASADDPNSITVPVFGAQACMGLGIEVLPEHDTVVGGMRLSEAWVRKNVGFSSPANLAVISAIGDSMEPTFRDGDIVLFDRGVTTLRLDAVYVVALGNELFIKRIQRRPDKRIVMKSDNPHYDPYVVPDEDMHHFRVIGKVVFAWNGRKM